MFRNSALKPFCLILMAIFFGVMISCQKNGNANSNKSNLSITNAASNSLPFNALLAGATITSSSKIAYGNTSGGPGNPYLSAVAGVNNFQATPDGSTFYVNGNLSLLTNAYYSVFVYDTLKAGQLKTLVLQDNLNPPDSPYAGLRLLNFSFDSVSLILVNGADTIVAANIPYADSIQNPGAASIFTNIASGSYQIFFLEGTTPIALDSMEFNIGKIYTLFSEGNLSTPSTAPPVLKLIQHN
ncbi:MAG: DUF4397 domain-containing protein [Chitinophagales bacterium]